MVLGKRLRLSSKILNVSIRKWHFLVHSGLENNFFCFMRLHQKATKPVCPGKRKIEFFFFEKWRVLINFKYLSEAHIAL